MHIYIHVYIKCDKWNSIFASEKLAFWWRRQTEPDATPSCPLVHHSFRSRCCSIFQDFLPLSRPQSAWVHSCSCFSHLSSCPRHLSQPHPMCLPPSLTQVGPQRPSLPSQLTQHHPQDIVVDLDLAGSPGCPGLAESYFQTRLYQLAGSLCPALCWPEVGARDVCVGGGLGQGETESIGGRGCPGPQLEPLPPCLEPLNYSPPSCLLPPPCFPRPSQGSRAAWKMVRNPTATLASPVSSLPAPSPLLSFPSALHQVQSPPPSWRMQTEKSEKERGAT